MRRLSIPGARLTTPAPQLTNLPNDLPTVHRKPSRQRGYTHRWDKATKTFLRRHPLCAGCKAVGRVEPAILTDHIIPHRGDMAKFWDSKNWQTLCRPHHNIVKAELERRFDRGELLPDDLRIDSDIAQEATRRLLG